MLGDEFGRQGEIEIAEGEVAALCAWIWQSHAA